VRGRNLVVRVKAHIAVMQDPCAAGDRGSPLEYWLDERAAP